MGVHAVLKDGRDVELAPSQGFTVDEVIEGITAGALTGSAVPLAEAKLTTTTGEEIAYVDVNTFAETSDFERGES